MHEYCLDIISNVSCLSERRCVCDREGYLKDAGEGLSEQSFSSACGTDQENVALLDFNVIEILEVFLRIDTLVVIVDGNGKDLLGMLLADHIIIEGFLDIWWSESEARASALSGVCCDVVANNVN